MDQAINLVFYIFNGFLDLLFNQVELLPGVYLGWVIISVLIFSIIFNSILNIPTGLINNSLRTKDRREYWKAWREQYKKNGG